MTGKLPVGRVTVSVGQPQNLAKSDNQKVTLEELASWFKEPLVTKEKFRLFKTASFKKKQQLKASAGWFIRCGIEGGIRNRKSVMPSGLITYDLDDVSPEMMESLLAGDLLPGVIMIGHTTRSHTPESPRLRLLIAVSKAIRADDYNRVSRIVALLIDPKLQHVDPVSFRPAQMMFFPSVSSDMLKHYVFYKQGGEKLDWEDEIEKWELTHGDSHDIRNLPKAASEPELRDVAEEAEDPLTKKGPVGDFCRAWSITALIEGQEDEDGNFVEGPLKDVYEIDDWEEGAASRCTYIGGHSTNGMVVYGDKFGYSHHGSDPASDQLLNAYDLVRIHLFGDKDAKLEGDEAMKDRPSVKAMSEWMKDDTFYRVQQIESRYGAQDLLGDEDLGDDYEDDEEADDEEEDDDLPSADDLLGVKWSEFNQSAEAVVERRRMFAPKPKKGWLRSLNLNDDGSIKSTGPNATVIVKNDPRMFRRIAFNELRQEEVLLDDLKSSHPALTSICCQDKVYGDRWQDFFTDWVDQTIQLESGKKGGGYDIAFAARTVAQAIRMASRHNAFHPVKDFFDTHAEGEIDVDLVETFLIRHAGAPDNCYIRDVTRNFAIAAVMRIEEPGSKFDFAPILEGKQGTGKSTLIRRLFGTEFFGELSTDISNPQRVAENLMGKWVLELPELSSLHRSDINDMKAFVTRQRDDVRLAYGNKVADLPRQCVFCGTTNDDEYLRDATGNRRYWPVPLDGRFIDPMGVVAERAIFWRTAVHLYREMRKAEQHGELDLSLQGESLKIARRLQEDRRKEEVSDTWTDRVVEWADEPVAVETLAREMWGESAALEDMPFGLEPGTMVKRVAFTRDAALAYALDQQRIYSSNVQDQNTWSKVLTLLENEGWQRPSKSNKARVMGKQKLWIIRADATLEDRQRGFMRLSDPPDENNDLI